MWKEQRWAPTSIRVLTARNYSSRPAVRTKLQGDTLSRQKSGKTRALRSTGQKVRTADRQLSLPSMLMRSDENRRTENNKVSNCVARIHVALINIYKTHVFYDKITNIAQTRDALLDSKLDLRMTNSVDVKTATNFFHINLFWLLTVSRFDD